MLYHPAPHLDGVQEWMCLERSTLSLVVLLWSAVTAVCGLNPCNIPMLKSNGNRIASLYMIDDILV